MKKWVCKHCGLYKNVNPLNIKSGCKVNFYKNINDISTSNHNSDRELMKGVVLRREKRFLIVVNCGEIFKIKDTDVYPQDAPNYFLYNLFGQCGCINKY